MIVWVCPTPGCGNYYGASSAGDLSAMVKPVSVQSGATPGSRGMRSACPDCLTRGLDVDRVPREVDSAAPGPSAPVLVVALGDLHERAQGLANRTGFSDALTLAHDIDALREMVA